MNYQVKFPITSIQKHFEKALEAVSPAKLQEEIMRAVEILGENPRPSGEPKIKPPLFVYQFTAHHRIRIRDYRVLYDVDDTRKTVWISALRRRNERTYR